MGATDTIIFLGKIDITPAEEEALFTLGTCIARSPKRLLTTPSPGAATAVREGYDAAEPKWRSEYLQNRPLPPSDGVVVALDARLIARLDERLPTWESEDWILLPDERTIIEFVSGAVTELELTNRCMSEHEHGGGGQVVHTTP